MAKIARKINIESEVEKIIYTAIIAALILLSAFLGLRALSYFYALCGVLHYLFEKYNDELDNETIKNLTIEAAKNIQW